MRIAQINLPTLDNNGASLHHVHLTLQNDLASFFEGFTAIEGQGAWLDAGKLYHEAVMVYQVAYEPNHVNRLALRNIATRIGKEAGQIAMFLVLDGESEIITI